MKTAERYDQSSDEAIEPNSTLFERLYRYDVSPLVQEMPTDFRAKYIPWATAWATFKKLVPDAIVEHHETEAGPFWKTECGYFVKISVTAEGHKETEVFPVTDNQFNAIKNPDPRDIADAFQRGLVKCLARHGFGLKLWEKEARANKILNGEIGHPGDYQITFGKFEGKKIKECDAKQLGDYVTWLSTQSKQTSNGKSLIEAYDQWKQIKEKEDVPY